MIHYVKGDLFTSDAELIAHGCNCVGGFGSGVAGIMTRVYPKSRVAYMEKHEGEGWHLGDIQVVQVAEGKNVANCATQFGYYPRNVCHADYVAIAEVMKKLKATAKANNWKIAIPKIGAGLAGGDWTIIETIIKSFFNDYDITVYYL